MTWRTLETLVWFAFYGALIAFMLIWNTASPTYKAIYVDRTASDWLPDGSRDYALGTEIRGSAFAPYFAEGWWRPEADMRWGRGTRHTLELIPTVDILAGTKLVTEVGVFQLRGARRRTVRVLLNDVEIVRLDMSNQNQTVSVKVPRLPAGVPVVIAFIVERAASPVTQGMSFDQRDLGVRFVSLVIGG